MKPALSVVIFSWQRSDHGYSTLMYETYSVSWHRLMITVRAYEYIPKVWFMLRQLSSSHDNVQNMVIYHSCMKHAPSVVIASWQRTEHGKTSLRYKTCTVSCHRLMTTVRVWWYSSIMSHALSVATVRAWLFIPKVWNMLRQLSSSHDNGQSMVIYP